MLKNWSSALSTPVPTQPEEPKWRPIVPCRCAKHAIGGLARGHLSQLDFACTPSTHM